MRPSIGIREVFISFTMTAELSSRRAYSSTRSCWSGSSAFRHRMDSNAAAGLAVGLKFSRPIHHHSAPASQCVSALMVSPTIRRLIPPCCLEGLGSSQRERRPQPRWPRRELATSTQGRWPRDGSGRRGVVAEYLVRLAPGIDRPGSPSSCTTSINMLFRRGAVRLLERAWGSRHGPPPTWTRRSTPIVVVLATTAGERTSTELFRPGQPFVLNICWVRHRLRLHPRVSNIVDDVRSLPPGEDRPHPISPSRRRGTELIIIIWGTPRPGTEARSRCRTTVLSSSPGLGILDPCSRDEICALRP